VKSRVWRSFSLWYLIGVHLIAIFAGFVAPYDFARQERTRPFAGPTRVHFVDSSGKFHLRPFVYGIEKSEDLGSGYTEDRSIFYPIQFLVSGDEYAVGPFHCSLHLFGIEGPERFYLLGADGFGRDQFSRMLYGGRISLFAGLLAAALAGCLGLLIGGMAGYYGGALDDLTMRFAEVFIAVPWFYLLVAVRAVLPLHLDPSASFSLVVITVGFVAWARPAKLVRGVILSAKERSFVLASRGFGASTFHILQRHIAPAASGVLLTQITLLVPQFVLTEVALSFLGLGVAEPVPSWGNMLAAAQHYNVLVSYWWMLIPGLVPIPTFIAYHALSDNLHARLDC